MTDFDAEELFHLGLKASEQGDKERSISFFKRAIELEPVPASYYLLGAEYAEIGMMSRAAECIQTAVDNDPELWTAWFQLGLVYLATQETDKAKESFKPLAALGDEAYLFHFAHGMNLLIEEDIEGSLTALARGLELNDDNPALNRDVQNIIDSLVENLRELQGQAVDDAATDEAPNMDEPDAGKGPTEHLLVSKYRNT